MILGVWIHDGHRVLSAEARERIMAWGNREPRPPELVIRVRRVLREDQPHVLIGLAWIPDQGDEVRWALDAAEYPAPTDYPRLESALSRCWSKLQAWRQRITNGGGIE